MITKQEMFNRAWLGLKAQGFKRAFVKDLNLAGSCVYLDDAGRRCAWGHVDPEGTVQASGAPIHGSVKSLFRGKIGLAGELDAEHLDFAISLQYTHDDGDSPALMEEFLRLLALKNDLQIPE